MGYQNQTMMNPSALYSVREWEDTGLDVCFVLDGETGVSTSIIFTDQEALMDIAYCFMQAAQRLLIASEYGLRAISDQVIDIEPSERDKPDLGKLLGITDTDIVNLIEEASP